MQTNKAVQHFNIDLEFKYQLYEWSFQASIDSVQLTLFRIQKIQNAWRK